MKEVDNANKIVQPIVFVNNPINSNGDDVIGFSSHVDTIIDAIDNGGANMIGIIADYGTGKTSMTEMLKNKYNDLGHPKPIRINMWDSLVETANQNSNERISNLTKSFLFQLANGNNRKLGSYVNKLLSKNYGTISFTSNHFKRLSWCLLCSAISYIILKISEISGTGIMQYLPSWCDVVASFYKLLSPVFILVSAIFAFCGIKDICVAFSHWKMTNKIPEINDIFDIYTIIVNEMHISKNKKQLVFIDDLDRIDNKKTIISFLKELYRFQDSICEEKSKFIFIISVMPESNLLKDEKEKNLVFSKIFDTTIFLKPIHFDDYDSILIQLINGDTEKKERLEKLIGETIEDHLPDSFKWIKRGSNLTLRDLKERLNQSISIMVSLINKSYVGNSAADFQACAAVSYLESRFPDDYYHLIQNEVQFAEFIKNSVPIINELDENSDEKLMQTFNKEFTGIIFSDEFKSELCLMILSEIIDDDFRMYFYTYPQGSHIKTTAEREICDYLLFPNQKNDYSGLSNAVEQAFKRGENSTVEAEIRVRSSFPRALLENDTLFVKSACISVEKLFLAFKKICLDVFHSEDEDKDIIRIWKRVLLLSDSQYKYFINKICSALIEKHTGNNILPFRRVMISAFGTKIINCADLFINENLPVISSEEIENIDDQIISIQLINVDKLSVATYSYISQLILSDSLKDKNKSVFNKAINIFAVYRTIKDDIENDILRFLHKNHYMDDKIFQLISLNIEDELLINYVNDFDPSELSNIYLSCINQKCIANGLSDELLKILIEKGYLITSLVHYSNQNKLDEIEVFKSSIEQVLDSCKIINDKYPNTVIGIRKEAYLSQGITEYLDLFREPYPLVTEGEYINETDPKIAISMIDVSRIDENEYAQIAIIHAKSYNQYGLILLFSTLFDTQNYDGVTDNDIKSELVQRLDFSLLGFKQLTFEQRDEIYILISDAIICIDAETIIEFLNLIDCFIPCLETRITDDKRYPKLIKSFDELSNVSIEWLKNNYITCALSEKLCAELFELKDYLNYIIANTLRIGILIIDNRIPFEDYLSVYKDSVEMFDIMSNHWNFLECFQQEANFSEYNLKHIVPAYKTKQHKRFFQYIDSLSQEEKKSYYKSFGKFASLDDSKAFRKLVCREDNMELLGDNNIRDHIKEQLWEEDRTDKGQFTKKWNQRWKKNLDHQRFIAIS